MKKILIVFGTRPELIKLYPVILELKKFPNDYIVHLCSTGQHREMLQQLLVELNITPDTDLDVMMQDQTLAVLTHKLIHKLQSVLEAVKPDLTIIQGDTTTAFSAALTSFYNAVPVAHVEAGLRTHTIREPFPEEFNRQTISKLADLHFCPTEHSKRNLLDEKMNPDSIIVTGNTIVDMAYLMAPKSNTRTSSKQILVTMHRRENRDRGINSLCRALKQIAKKHPELTILFPVHPSPTIFNTVHSSLSNVPSIQCVPPLNYRSFLSALASSSLVLTDSGGVQEEAVTLGIPVFVLRNQTERIEGIKSKQAQVIGIDSKKIVAEVDSFLSTPHPRPNHDSVYGDGTAAKRIVTVIREFLTSR